MPEPTVILRRGFDDGKRARGLVNVGPFDFYSLERPWVDNRPFVSCIPPGRYPLVLEESPKFKTLGHDYGDGLGMLWEIKDVPGRSECKFHAANWVNELQGCIALGTPFARKLEDGSREPGVMNSRSWLEMFHEALKPHKRAWIEVFGPKERT